MTSNERDPVDSSPAGLDDASDNARELDQTPPPGYLAIYYLLFRPRAFFDQDTRLEIHEFFEPDSAEQVRPGFKLVERSFKLK